MPNQPGAGDSSPPPRRSPGGQPTPRDAVFRQVFGVPANAASQLRAVLPADLAARLDLGKLAPVPGSFVDEALRWRHSDLLFTAPLDGQDAFVYLLIEHQSSDDPLPRFEFLLDDLSGTDEQQLRDRDLTPEAEITLLLLKTALGNPQLPALLRRRAGQLRAVLGRPGGGETFVAFLTYIELVSDTPAGELHDLAASLGPDAEEAYVTTAEMLRAEGEARGRAEERAKALVEVLTVKFGPLPESVPKTVRAASIEQMRAWTAHAVTAETLDEVFD